MFKEEVKMKYIKLGIIMGAFLFPSIMMAQNPDSLDVGVKVTVNGVFDLILDEVYDYHPTYPGNVTPSSDDTVDYFNRDPGQDYIVGSLQGYYAIHLIVRNNMADVFYLKTKGTGDFTSGSYSFSLSNLKWAIDGDPTGQVWTPFTTTYTQVASDVRGEFHYYIDYKLTIPWNAPAAQNYRTRTRYLLTTTP
jgi:hypothetical protein